MQHKGDNNIQNITLEAPGDFLSELLGVSKAEVLTVNGVLELSDCIGMWRILGAADEAVRIMGGETNSQISPGQALAVSGDEEVTLISGTEAKVCHVILSGIAAKQVLKDCQERGGLFFERGGETVLRMFRLLGARQGRTVPASEASEYAYSLLMSLYGTGKKGPESTSSIPPVVEAAIGIIRRDYAYLEGISELAKRLEVSQEYLTRCFFRYTGVTPGRYLNQVRIENAKLLLRRKKHTVQFVSDACGFANANYFARVFRKYAGVNPRDYVRMQKESENAGEHEDRLYVL